MYLDVLNYEMVGFGNISAWDMLNHLFTTYNNITKVDLENNFEHMRRAWDPQQPVESLFKQIQDCADYSEAGVSLLDTNSKYMLDMQKYLQLGTSRAAVAGGTKNHLLKRLGHNLRPTSPLLTVNTSKFKVNLPQHPDTTLPTQLLDKHKTKWLKPPLGN
jgi:hypothetical protein